MAGLGIPIKGVTSFPGSTAPFITPIDPVAPAAGGLLFIEVNHPLGGFPAGVPTDDAVVTNLFRDQASTLLGVPASSLDPVMRVVGLSGSLGKIERTPKGGVHVIQSTTQTGLDQGFQIPVPLPIVAHMKANPNHEYVATVWNRATRIITSGTFYTSYMYIGELVTAADSVALGLGNVRPAAGTGQILVGHYKPWHADLVSGSYVANNNVPASIAASSFEASFTGAPNTAGRYAMFEVGNFNGVNQHATYGRGKQGARAFWRAMLIDLTAAGWTYAQFAALDQAEFTKQFGVGGRYYGDAIPTDPATIP